MYTRLIFFSHAKCEQFCWLIFAVFMHTTDFLLPSKRGAKECTRDGTITGIMQARWAFRDKHSANWSICVISDINYGFGSWLFWQSFQLDFLGMRNPLFVELFASESNLVSLSVFVCWLSCQEIFSYRIKTNYIGFILYYN